MTSVYLFKDTISKFWGTGGQGSRIGVVGEMQFNP